MDKKEEIGLGFLFWVFKHNTDYFTRELMVKKGFKEDIRQELELILLEVKNREIIEEMSMKEKRRYIAKRIYQFLKNYGFRKKRDPSNPKRIIWWFDWEEDFRTEPITLEEIEKYLFGE